MMFLIREKNVIMGQAQWQQDEKYFSNLIYNVLTKLNLVLFLEMFRVLPLTYSEKMGLADDPIGKIKAEKCL